MHAVHQHDHAFSRLTGDEPAVNCRAAGAGKFNVLDMQSRRWIANGMIRRRYEHGSDIPDKDDAKDKSGKYERAKMFPSPSEFHLTLTTGLNISSAKPVLNQLGFIQFFGALAAGFAVGGFRVFENFAFEIADEHAACVAA